MPCTPVVPIVPQLGLASSLQLGQVFDLFDSLALSPTTSDLSFVVILLVI